MMIWTNGGQGLTNTSFTTAKMMAFAAILALDFYMLRVIPPLVFQIPVFMFLIMALNLALAMAVCGRPLRTFYFTFLLVGIALTSVFTAFFFSESNPGPGSLIKFEIAIHRILAVRKQSSVVLLYTKFPIFASFDGCVSCLFGVIPALVSGMLGASLACRHSSDFHQWPAVFLRGVLIGLGVIVCIRFTLTLCFGPGIIPKGGLWAALILGALNGGVAALALRRIIARE